MATPYHPRCPSRLGAIHWTHTSRRISILTGWRKCIGCLDSHVTSRTSATYYRSLVQETTCKDKAFYASSPPLSVVLQSEPMWEAGVLNILRAHHTGASPSRVFAPREAQANWWKPPAGSQTWVGVTATHCPALQQPATRCNALQHGIPNLIVGPGPWQGLGGSFELFATQWGFQNSPIYSPSAILQSDTVAQTRWMPQLTRDRVSKAHRTPYSYVTFRKLPIDYSALLRKMTCGDKGFHKQVTVWE